MTRGELLKNHSLFNKFGRDLAQGIVHDNIQN